MIRYTVAQIRNRFKDILKLVTDKGETIVITKHGKNIALIVPYNEFNELSNNHKDKEKTN